MEWFACFNALDKFYSFEDLKILEKQILTLKSLSIFVCFSLAIVSSPYVDIFNSNLVILIKTKTI